MPYVKYGDEIVHGQDIEFRAGGVRMDLDMARNSTIVATLTSNIVASDTPPLNPQVNDLWVDTS